MLFKSLKSSVLNFALILALLGGFFGAVPVQASAVLHVKWNASGANNGTSWADAYTDLQSAFSAAISGDEIWVATGTYKPTLGTDRTISYTLKNGVSIYGGFAGTETLLTQRDFAANITVLSGDIGVLGDNSDNSYHVVIGSNTNNSAIMDGFTVISGNADSVTYPSDRSKGGGIYNYNGKPTIMNVIFSENYGSFGGGMYNGGEYNYPNGSNPILMNVTFSNNSAIEGGGMRNEDYSSPSLTNMTFSGNTVVRAGGGMENLHYSSPILTNVTFSDNIGGAGGGGMINFTNSSPILTNVTFHANSATDWGGGMYNSNTTNPSLRNVTFSGNSATEGGGMYNEYGSDPNIANSILYGNPGGEIFDFLHESQVVSYSIVQGGYPGTGNLNADPLLGPLQDNGGFTQTMALGAGSPAIDVGDNTNCPATDQRNVARPQGSGCDIGAFEYAEGPILTVTPSPVSPTPTWTPTSASTVTFTPSVTPTRTPTRTPTKTPTSTPTYTPTSPPLLFNPYVNYTGGSGQSAQAVGIGDFNSDGLQDVAMSITNQLLIYLQKSDGSLASPVAYATFATGSSSRSLAAGDLNNDGRADVVTVDGNTISVYLQQSDGTLAARLNYPTSTTPDAVAIGDVNNDGLADIAVSHWNAGNIGIFLQNANGSLNSMITYSSPQAGYDDIAIGDVNNDGRNDVVKMNGQLYANPNLSVYLQGVNGSLAAAVPYSLGCNCLGNGIGIGDVTGDGRSDIVMSYGGNRPDSRIAVFAQGASGLLQAPVSYAAYDIPEPVEVADVNQDGLVDVLTAHGGWGRMSMLPQQPNGVLGTYKLYPIAAASNYYPQSLAIGDINHDSLPDVAIADYSYGLVVLYHGSSSIPNPPTPTRVPINTATSTPSPTVTSTFTPTNTPTNTLTNTPTFTPTNTFTPTVTPPYSYNPLYLSLTGNQTIGGVTSADEDVLKFDGAIWSLFFDGSDVGVGSSDLFGLSFMDADSLLLSFTTALTLNGISVTPQDVVRFDATSLGSNTAGTFSMYLDGSDVGFDTTAEKIDSVSLLPDGRVLISTTGNPSVPGLTTGKDEDVLAFTPTSLGNVTSGSWTMYFDGSDVGLAETSGEDVDALDVVGGKIYLSTADTFSVNGLTGVDEDVFVCVPTSLGDVTACNYSPSLYFDGSTWNLSANDVDAFNLLSTGSVPTFTPTSTAGNPTNTPSQTSTATPIATFTPTRTPTMIGTTTPSPTFTRTYTLTITSTSPISTLTSIPSSTPTTILPVTATNTPNVSDLIFADSFESGSFSAWTSNTNDVGDLGVSASAALVGTQGMQALIDDANAIYVTDDNPNAEPRYRARFYFDPNSIIMASNDAHFIFKGFAGTATDVFQVELRNSSGLYQIRAKVLNDSSAFVVTNWFTISDASHFIEVDWRAATGVGANNGGLTLWIDGTQQANLTGIDNDTWRIDRARLGALAGMDVGTSGTYYFDAFESRRQNYIGP